VPVLSSIQELNAQPLLVEDKRHYFLLFSFRQNPNKDLKFNLDSSFRARFSTGEARAECRYLTEFPKTIWSTT
jgi:hypothetical protein